MNDIFIKMLDKDFAIYLEGFIPGDHVRCMDWDYVEWMTEEGSTLIKSDSDEGYEFRSSISDNDYFIKVIQNGALSLVFYGTKMEGGRFKLATEQIEILKIKREE